MDNAETPENSDETTAVQWHGDKLIIKENFFDQRFVFPPNHHEGLPVSTQEDSEIPPLQQPPSSLPAAAPPSSSSQCDGEEESSEQARSDFFRRRLGILRSGIVRAAYTVRNYSRRRKESLSTLAAMAGVAVAVVLAAALYVRLRRRRRVVPRQDKERLMLLVREKDQKISQLLLQIAEMNEAVLARHRVPVLRME